MGRGFAMLKRILILALCAALPASALAGGYGGYYHGSHYGYGHSYYGYHGSDGDALVAGLVIGGLFGYLINQNRYQRSSYDWAYRYRDYPYYRRGYAISRPGYWRLAPAPRRVVVQQPAPRQASRCRMTREYTTTIVIDGESRQAYGSRCMTAGGAWQLSAPKLVPRFE